MTTAELLNALAREYPNGVSFDPMAVRLLRHKVQFEDGQIKELKAEMFELENGLWITREMVLDNESRLAFQEQATKWLMEFGCFSVKRLFEGFQGILRHISTLEDCVAFLRHLGFTVAAWGKFGLVCVQPSSSRVDPLSATAKTISERLEEAGGTLAFNAIEEAMPHLTSAALEGIRAQFLPDVNAVDVGGLPCWCSVEAIPLPEDFSEKLTTAVDTLVDLKERVNAANLTFALNVICRSRFREEYDLPDNDTFMRVCAKYYKGGNAVFRKSKKPLDETDNLSDRRVRSPNTRFLNLGVPIGAKLAFTKDSHIICTVLDDSNQVEYGGKVYAISALANSLLKVSGLNGFCYFRYEGETLWERRLRLEREGKHDGERAAETPPPTEVKEADGKIIGLEGRLLSPITWRAFKRAGANSTVAEWARRVESGESVECIAGERGLMVATVKEYIKNRRRYLAVCEKNGIAPEVGADV